MKVLLVLAAAFVCFVAAGDDLDNQNWVDYRLVSNYDDPPDPSQVECVVPGKMCSGCKDVYLCTNTTGKWDVSWMEGCEGTQTCDSGKCVDVPNSGCALEGKNFDCVSLEGVYPDPGTCTKFYYCVPGEDGGVKKIESSCGANSKYGYNTRTTYCDVALVNNKCGVSSVPICKTSGQTAALKENPSMYYICKPYEAGKNTLYPFLYICPNGRSYDNNYGCKPK